MAIKNDPVNTKNVKISKLFGTALFFSGLIFGILFSIIAINIKSSSTKTDKEFSANSEAYPVREGGYKYINPLLECEVGNVQKTVQLKNLETKLNEEIKNRTNSKSISEISVYFRDLNNGPWIGINEDTNFRPASLLKVPVMIAYLKLADTNPELLKQELEVPTDTNLPTQADELEPLVVGRKYTIEDLLGRMIVYSDNQAFTVLTSSIDSDKLDKIHQDLGLKIPSLSLSEAFVSVREYASLFRVLYNASYLGRNMSEYALALMSAAKFEKGLNGGVGDEVVVSHKFGLRVEENENDKGAIQLHDCGVIYHPKTPYILCVMTRGNNYEELASVIQTISKITFSELSSK